MFFCWIDKNSFSASSTEYCVGSSAEKDSDVVDCMNFERPEDSATMKIEGLQISDGKVSVLHGNSTYNVSDTLSKPPPSEASGLNLEPGK